MNLNLAQLTSHPELLDKETLYQLRTLLVRYPFCQTLRLLLLKNLFLLHDSMYGDELKNSVLYVGDRSVLFKLIEADKYIPLSYQTHPGIDRTFALIDAFLSAVPLQEDKEPQDTFQYISDYTAYLESTTPPEEEDSNTQSQLRGQTLIDRFITKSETDTLSLKPLDMPLPNEEDDPDDSDNSTAGIHEDDDSYFTETLAKIYIKQQRYNKAIEIIKKLSLKYPKKNAYFADQIRFLEKLIINAKSK